MTLAVESANMAKQTGDEDRASDNSPEISPTIDVKFFAKAGKRFL